MSNNKTSTINSNNSEKSAFQRKKPQFKSEYSRNMYNYYMKTFFSQVRLDKQSKYKKIETSQYKDLIDFYKSNSEYDYVTSGINSAKRELIVIDVDNGDSKNLVLDLINLFSIKPNYIKEKNNGHFQIGWFIKPIRTKIYDWNGEHHKYQCVKSDMLNNDYFINNSNLTHYFKYKKILTKSLFKKNNETLLEFDMCELWKFITKFTNHLFGGDVMYTGFNCQNPYSTQSFTKTTWLTKPSEFENVENRPSIFDFLHAILDFTQDYFDFEKNQMYEEIKTIYESKTTIQKCTSIDNNIIEPLKESSQENAKPLESTSNSIVETDKIALAKFDSVVKTKYGESYDRLLFRDVSEYRKNYLKNHKNKIDHVDLFTSTKNYIIGLQSESKNQRYKGYSYNDIIQHIEGSINYQNNYYDDKKASRNEQERKYSILSKKLTRIYKTLIVNELVEKNYSIQEIAKITNLGISTVYKYAKNMYTRNEILNFINTYFKYFKTNTYIRKYNKLIKEILNKIKLKINNFMKNSPLYLIHNNKVESMMILNKDLFHYLIFDRLKPKIE